ncbi:hypothetical protein V8C37DRAFT_71230 [Trichoderma ceciliae]
MAADVLPSYQQAISRGDWVQLAAPYIDFADYSALCRVNRHYWSIFAPLLWRDPCAASKRLGRSVDGDTISWWIGFIHQRLDQLTAQTRALIRVLDARDATGENHFNLFLGLTESAFERALELLPNVESLLIDDHADLDVRFLRRVPRRESPGYLRLLSLQNCPNGVSVALASARCLRELIYLDISGTSIVAPQLLEVRRLPDLRILKLRRKGIDTKLFNLMARIFKHRLWSLDLSDNRLTDSALASLLNFLVPTTPLRSNAHAQVEGALIKSSLSTASYGPFRILRESSHSTVFRHSERYLVDAPAYRTTNAYDGGTGYLSRSDGSVTVRPDTADGVLHLLSHDNGTVATNHLPGSRSITHLHLSGNQFSAAAVEKMLRMSNGQLEHFDCSSMRLYPPTLYAKTSLSLSNRVKLDGFSGMSHVFRPVWSCNLRSLRIHHSLVTNIPTLKIRDHHTIECIYLAEQQILPGLDIAYPLVFLPDMNPRLESLTLTCIPRHSFGPLIQKLASFLQLLGEQECALANMKKAEASAQGRPLRLVSGLRHLALEMEPDAMAALELDAGELMADGENQFSFFSSRGEEQLEPLPPQQRLVHVWSCPSMSPDAPKPMLVPPSAAYNPAPLANPNRDYSKEQWVAYRERSRAESEMVVWAGNPESQHPVIQIYNNLVLKCGMQEGAGPVNLPQVMAGAPEECIIFHSVWFFASLPQQLQTPPLTSLRRLGVIRDVAIELRQHRFSEYEGFVRTREHRPNQLSWYWGGAFEIIDPTPNDEDQSDVEMG